MSLCALGVIVIIVRSGKDVALNFVKMQLSEIDGLFAYLLFFVL